MAILKKRTSSKQLPEARGLDRAPLNSIIQGVNQSPSISGGSSSLTSSGSGSKPSLTTQTGSSNLTSTTGSKPAVTNTTPKTPTSITTSPSTVARQTAKPNVSRPNSTTSKVVNALSGAAIGAGTKMLIDKITSKPNMSKTPQQTAKEIAALEAAKLRDKASAERLASDKRASDLLAASNKKAAEELAKANAAKINPSTGKPVGTGFGDDKEEFMTDSLGNIYKTMPDGSYSLYRAAEVNEDEVAGLDANQIAPLDPNENAFVPEYFEDSLGNIYVSTPDGEYDLYRAAEVEDDGEAFPSIPPEEEYEYFEDSLGNIYRQGADGEYDLYRAAEVPEEDYDLFNGDNTDYIDYQPDERYATQDDGDEYYDYRRGGLITMMKQGGVAHMADGGYMPEGAVDNGDGTYTIGRYTYDMMTDEYLYSTDDGQITNVSPDAVYSTGDEEDYFTADSLGNIFKNGQIYMNAADVPTDIKSSGGGNRNWYDDYVRPVLSGGSKLASDALSGISGALGTTAGAAGAGALVATLLGQDFSGGTGEQNQGLDMSKVGVINPRTTDFGIGPTKFVGYEDYGTGGGDYTPNEELLRNLNAPGFNPVREGDYGYEEAPAETPKMASGGLSSMATPVSSYYTFGQPADILANLGMRAQPPMNPPEMMPQIGQQQPPYQAQQQGLPQQMPEQMTQQMPQGMPQQGIMPQQNGMPPPMRKGGLPHASNVPMVEGRMDFRRGSAVHGAGDGQSDDIPAMLADGEYVIDAETVAQIGNGSTKAGAQALDKFREGIRAHKRGAPLNKIPPKTKPLTSYLKGAK